MSVHSTPGDPSDPPPLPPFWRWLEAWFQRVYDIRPLYDEPGCLLAYNRAVHRGTPVVLCCGTEVRDGDPLLELHFRREALAPLVRDGDPGRMGLELMRLAERDVPRLALELERDPAFAEIKALHALTLFHRGVRRYGFEVMPVRPKHVEWWFTTWHRLVMARDHASGAERVRTASPELVTRHIWVSRAELIRRYGEAGSKRAGRSLASGAAPP